MKLRILSFSVFLLLTQSNILSQWIQTNGPYGPVNATSFFTFDTLKFVATSCGLFSSGNIRTQWSLENVLDINTFTIKGDSLFVSEHYGGLSIIDMSLPGFTPEPFYFEPSEVNALISSDSCLYACLDYRGFYKSAGFRDEWERLNDGLPADSGIIPPKFGGGKYYFYFVFSIDFNAQYIFAGTQRGIYRADPASMVWESINAGLPVAKVSLINIIDNIIYICIDKTIYKSTDGGESWEIVYTSVSEITSINEIAGILYLTTKGIGIILSTDGGINWVPFNNELEDLSVNFVGKMDTALVCGTSSQGFYYYSGGTWNQNNAGIICSVIRSIIAVGDSLIANDYQEVYRSDNRNDWSRITPSVNRELFGGMAAIGETVFLSVELDTPYEQPYIIYTPDKGITWKNLNKPVPFVRDDPYNIYCYKNRLYAFEDERSASQESERYGYSE